MNDIVLSLPFLTAFIFSFGGGASTGWIKKPKIFRRTLLGLAIAGFTTINQPLDWAKFFAIWGLFFGATSLGYGQKIRDRNWSGISLVGASYGAGSLAVFMLADRWDLAIFNIALCSIGFCFCVWLSNFGPKLTWKFAEGLTGFILGLLPAFAMWKR